MANGELTPEAIDAFIAASQALSPRDEPPVAPPSMQFVSPPVTRLPNPVVPLPMGVPQRFTATSAPPVFDPLEDIRKQINAVQFKTAQDALDAATHFQALRAYQRDLEAGKDPTRWLPLIFKKNPTAIAGMMRERRLATPPAVFQGSNVPPAVVYGGRVAFPPAASLPKPPLSTNVTEFFAPGTTNRLAFGIPTGPQSRQLVQRAEEFKEQPFKLAEFRKLLDREEDVQKEISFYEGLPELEKEEKELLQRKKAELEAIGQQKTSLKAGTTPATPKAEAKRIRVVSPTGKTGTVSEANLEEAMKAGYKRL